MQAYLQPTSFLDFEHPSIQQYGDHVLADVDLADKITVATTLYQAVRDDIRYNPYVFSPTPESFSASHCLAQGKSYCIPKAVLLAALARRYGIPSKVGFADVKNHLSTQQLIDFLRSEVFVMHGYAELWLEGRWVKATPAFDAELCQRMQVATLDFNGREDSVFHEFNGEGQRHMEYVREHGSFDDVPHEFILRSVTEAYPHLVENLDSQSFNGRSLETDMAEH